MATFVLVQAYSSTLFTYIVTPMPVPLLVNTVYDVVKKPEIHLVVEGGRSFDNAIMVLIISLPFEELYIVLHC